MDLITASKVDEVWVLNESFESPYFNESNAVKSSLHVTPHHIILRETASGSENWIPHPLIQSLVLHRPLEENSRTALVLNTRTFKVYTVLFDSEPDAVKVWESAKNVSTNLTSVTDLYAFVNKLKDLNKSRDYWNIYDPAKEFARMGVGSENPRTAAWRFCKLNSTYEFCPTYPATMVVPSKIGDATLKHGKDYRSKERIPALVYLHWANFGSITRSSQPMVGLKNARSIQDEKLIEAIFHSHAQHTTTPSSPNRPSISKLNKTDISSEATTAAVYGAMATNLIIDARPTTNAVANSVKGAGTENMDYYRNCKKAYLGVDSIHVMRAALKGVLDAFQNATITGYLDRGLLQRSGWLKHLSALIEGVSMIVKNIHLANSHVLIHCSDGWDRTSQLSSLSQLCLDPYYRTIKGFAVLIEKEWLSFGHRFADRSGHVAPGKTAFAQTEGDDSLQGLVSSIFQISKQHQLREISPVFHQFLDCVWQIMHQFPCRFEFNTELLVDLLYHLYSCEYGTFLFNSERERTQGRADSPSVWQAFFTISDDDDQDFVAKPQYLNSEYDPNLDDHEYKNSPKGDQGILFPNPRNLKFCPVLFQHKDEDMNVAILDEGALTPSETIVVGPSNNNSPAPIIPRPSEGVSSTPTPIDNSKLDPLVSSSPSFSTPSSSVTTPIKSTLSSPGDSTSPFDSPSVSAAGGTAHFQSALASVVRFGGSTWSSVSKSYQGALKDYGPGSFFGGNAPGETPLDNPTSSYHQSKQPPSLPPQNGGRLDRDLQNNLNLNDKPLPSTQPSSSPASSSFSTPVTKSTSESLHVGQTVYSAQTEPNPWRLNDTRIDSQKITTSTPASPSLYSNNTTNDVDSRHESSVITQPYEDQQVQRTQNGSAKASPLPSPSHTTATTTPSVTPEQSSNDVTKLANDSPSSSKPSTPQRQMDPLGVELV